MEVYYPINWSAFFPILVELGFFSFVWCYFRFILFFWTRALSISLSLSLYPGLESHSAVFSPFPRTMIALDLLHVVLSRLFFAIVRPVFFIFYEHQQTSTLYTPECAYVFAEHNFVEQQWVSDCRYCNRLLSSKLYFRYSFFSPHSFPLLVLLEFFPRSNWILPSFKCCSRVCENKSCC